MSIKTSFSIKDLENLSGIKAHTIRIWEKRYDLLRPERSGSNIRTYNLENLKKLLNIALLNDNGVKVSKIASISEEELFRRVRELMVERNDHLHSLNAFKLSMLNFDRQLFDDTYNQLLVQTSFRDIFLKVFIKLLEDIGMLWITKTITPAHEHFISTLIKQKLLTNIERIQSIKLEEKNTFLLFLPLNEIHDIGLMYVHFELLLRGFNSIYLGSSIPIDNLLDVQKIFGKITYISYFTVEPSIEKVDTYLREVSQSILSVRNEKMHIMGRNTAQLDIATLPTNVVSHKSLVGLIDELQQIENV